MWRVLFAVCALLPVAIVPSAAQTARAPADSAQKLTPEALKMLRSKDSFQECADCPVMIVVGAGIFTMGSSAGEDGRDDNEGPQRRVRIAQAFAIGKFEVTFAQWDACVADGGCNGYRPDDSGWGRGNQPVINVDWNDGQAYIDWLNRRAGTTAYRYVSEAEWEYSARAGTLTPFWTGATISTGQANYSGLTAYQRGAIGENRQRALAVGSFPANPFGLYDLNGNVWEWVRDCRRDLYDVQPVDGSAYLVANCSGRMIRGGSWDDAPQDVRSAARYDYGPTVRANFVGFRVARSLVP